jgi:hypothetical protein
VCQYSCAELGWELFPLARGSNRDGRNKFGACTYRRTTWMDFPRPCRLCRKRSWPYPNTYHTVMLRSIKRTGRCELIRAFRLYLVDKYRLSTYRSRYNYLPTVVVVAPVSPPVRWPPILSEPPKVDASRFLGLTLPIRVAVPAKLLVSEVPVWTCVEFS